MIEQLRALTLEEIGRWSRASVRELCALRPVAEVLSPSLFCFLSQHREEVAAWLDAATSSPGPGETWAQNPARFLGAQTIRWLLQRNQFLEIEASQRAALDVLYQRALCTMRDALRIAGDEGSLKATLEQLLAERQRALAAFVLELDRASGMPGFVFREVVSSEYSAELQRSILGLEGAPLSEPILDLGCGVEAHLVHALRCEGRLAFGVDRVAEEGGYIFQGDWLSWPLPPGSWGAILSHQGFSNHFLHQHLRTGGEATRYARRYMEILRALKPGGVFVYAPGLPFIEALLPVGEYRVKRRPISAVTGFAAPLAVAAPALPVYACRVEKVAA